MNIVYYIRNILRVLITQNKVTNQNTRKMFRSKVRMHHTAGTSMTWQAGSRIWVRKDYLITFFHFVTESNKVEPEISSTEFQLLIKFLLSFLILRVKKESIKVEPGITSTEY